MTAKRLPAPPVYRPAAYWEARARRFARDGAGLAAVCSYGMPGFYNRQIELCQRLALAPWLDVAPGTRVLDVGCGVGRWSRLLAARGALVTGIDISATMIQEATRRARSAGVADRCRFLLQDFATLEVAGRFDLVLSVTVLQHMLETQAVHTALRRVMRHLSPGGRIVALEAAPVRNASRCDSSIFRARPREEYLQLFRDCGLEVRALGGVDPAPFKTWLLPHLPRLPRPLATLALVLATSLSAPFDLTFGRHAVERSWHAVFVLERPGGG
jgi:SAM-dependent methyltransferase